MQKFAKVIIHFLLLIVLFLASFSLPQFELSLYTLAFSQEKKSSQTVKKIKKKKQIKNTRTKAKSTKIEKKETDIQERDAKIARSFIALRGQLKAKKKNLKNLDSLQEEIGKSSIFQEFSPLILNLKKIHETSNPVTLLKLCPKSNQESSLYTELENSVSDYCKNKALSNIDEKNLNSSQISVLKELILYYFNSNNSRAITQFFKKAEKHPKTKESLLTLLNEISKDLQKCPSLRFRRSFEGYAESIHNSPICTKLEETKFFSKKISSLITALSQDLEALPPGENIKSILQELKAEVKNSKLALSQDELYNALFPLAKDCLNYSQFDTARELFQLLKEFDPDPGQNELHFQNLWSYLLQEKNDNALDYIREENLDKNFDSYSSQLQYWIIETYLRNNLKENYESLYNKIIIRRPHNFYTIIAVKDLSELKNIKKRDFLLPDNLFPKEKSSVTLSDAEESSPLIVRMSLWINLRYDIFIDAEASKFLNLAEKDGHLKEAYIKLINFFSEKSAHLFAFKYANEGQNLNILDSEAEIFHALYPKQYFDLVSAHTGTIDPLLVLALMRQESAFNPYASSHAGAKGLMQLLPATARRYQRRVSSRQLHNPKINVRLGIKYLEFLLKRYNGNIIFALAAYNAGEHRVDKWKETVFLNRTDHIDIIESIPYKETRNYVKLVYRNFFFYKLQFEKEDLTSKNDSFILSPIKLENDRALSSLNKKENKNARSTDAKKEVAKKSNKKSKTVKKDKKLAQKESPKSNKNPKLILSTKKEASVPVAQKEELTQEVSTQEAKALGPEEKNRINTK